MPLRSMSDPDQDFDKEVRLASYRDAAQVSEAPYRRRVKVASFGERCSSFLVQPYGAHGLWKEVGEECS